MSPAATVDQSSLSGRGLASGRSPSDLWAGYAACTWALLFAAASFYWAAGGTLGADTVSTQIKRLPAIAALLLAVAVAKVVGGLLALSLVCGWGAVLPRRLRLRVSWAAGVGMVLYGAANLAVRGVMAVGVIRPPASMHSSQATWHLALWDPWWLLGGILFCAAAWAYGRRPQSG